jgi:hypothetical protein
MLSSGRLPQLLDIVDFTVGRAFLPASLDGRQECPPYCEINNIEQMRQTAARDHTEKGVSNG